MAFNSLFRERHKKIHMVGIGGIGMSGIARVLLASGFNVSGSDLTDGHSTAELRNLGAQIFIGHDSSHVGDADVLVYSSAITRDNPELIQAEQSAIPIIPRAVMLAELMRLRCGIAISGSHGKTTTTSLVATLMHNVGLDPTVVIGGIINHFGCNAVVGQGQYMVTEADESDGSFLHLAPTIAVVTNIDAEHLDFYRGGIGDIKASFARFLASLPFYGLAVLCIDDPNVYSLLDSINRRITTYGFHEHAMYRAQNIKTDGMRTTFDLVKLGAFIHTITINMVGNHNVLNTLAAIAVLEELGISSTKLLNLLHEFDGVKRRFTPVRREEGFTVIDDYAHHPTEIKAVLNAARACFAHKKLRVLFQPHRFSRTKDLFKEFSTSFADCDSLIVTDIYPAAEKPIEGITAQALLKNICEHSNARLEHATTLHEAAHKIVDQTERDDVVLVLGAGSVTHAAPHIVDLLIEKYGRVL